MTWTSTIKATARHWAKSISNAFVRAYNDPDFMLAMQLSAACPPWPCGGFFISNLPTDAYKHIAHPTRCQVEHLDNFCQATHLDTPDSPFTLTAEEANERTETSELTKANAQGVSQ